MPSKCYVIAEAGLNHNGSMEIAKKMINLAALAGCDSVKFQKRDVENLAIQTVMDAEDLRFPNLGKTYRQVRESLEFSLEEYSELKRYTEAQGMDFICTAFDVASVDFLEKLGLQVYKLASHSLTNIPLLKYLASKGKRVYFSTGMCTLEEIDTAVEVLRSGSKELVMFHCVSAYPHEDGDANLQMMDVLEKRYPGVSIGYSGHELGYIPTLAAVARGAVAVERHFTLDKKLEGFDHKISLDPAELIEMVKMIRKFSSTYGDGKKEVSAREQITRDKYHVSMVAKGSINKGVIIEESMITYKNPGTGIPPKKAHLIIGKKAAVNISADSLLKEDMVENK